MKLFLIFVFVAAASCTSVFYDPDGQIDKGRANCAKNKSIKPTCQDLCALQNVNMITASGNGINPKEFGPIYQKYAKSCWNTTGKPTCEDARKFMDCFYDKYAFVEKEIFVECYKQFPDKNSQLQKDDYACLNACIAKRSYVINDDDTINIDCINPHIPFEFDAVKIAQMCKDKHKQEDKCHKLANMYNCLTSAFDKAEDDFANKQKLKN